MSPEPEVSFEPTCLVNGRKFVQSGQQWIDAAVFGRPDAHRIRVQFDTREYFELLGHCPEAVPFLQLGRNLQFLSGDTVYEIHE